MSQAEEEIVNFKRDLENSIRNCMQRFEERTNLNPSKISVILIETTVFGHTTRKFSLERVEVRIEA